MKKILFLLLGVFLFLTVPSYSAPVQHVVIDNPTASPLPVVFTTTIPVSGGATPIPWTSASPEPVICVSGCSTPIPFPTLGANVLNTPAVTIANPGPTNGSGIPLVAPTNLPNPLPVTTPPPFSGAVTGTFWQATQPVSGTFWQTTQPVSGTVQPGNTPNTTPWLTTIQQGGIPASVYNYGGGDYGSANALAVSAQQIIFGTGACSGSPQSCPAERAKSASFGNNVNSTGLPANAAYCQYNSTLPTLTTGNYSAMQCDANGRVYAVSSRVATTNTTIAVNSGTTTLVTGVGRLHGVLTTTVGATAFTCYDNTAASGTLIFDQALSALGIVTLPSGGIAFTTGLTCVSGATGPAVTVFTGPS